MLQAEIGFSKKQEKQLYSPETKSPSTGNLYGKYGQILNSHGIRFEVQRYIHFIEKNMPSLSQRQEGIYAKLAYLDDLLPDQKILKLQEISIQLIKEHHYDDALEYLLEADVLVRNELPANNPQQM